MDFKITTLVVSALFLSTQALADRYVIVGGDQDGLKDEVGAQGGQVLENIKYVDGFVANISGKAARGLQKKYGASAKIEKDFVVSLPDQKASGKPPWAGGGDTTPTQPPQETPWGIDAVQAPAAWAVTRGAGVTVCIVDTGIQPDHPDLQTGIQGENFVAKGRKAADPNKWADDHGHGTHVSGTVAALDNTIGVVGVAPDATLRAAKVLDSRGSGYSSWVASGIIYCADSGADVISMSLGSSSPSSLIQDAVTYADAAGVTIVAAAGNDSGGPVSYPAAFPQVIAVSAVDSSNQLAYFSNVGPEVNFAAPGVAVTSTTYGSDYATWNGTSMATPHVSGVAALMIAAGKAQLQAQDIGLAPEEQGAGLIDALATVLGL